MKNLKRISYCIRGYPIFIFHFNLWFSRNDTTFLLKDWGVVMGVSIFIIMAMSNLKVKAFLNKSVFVYLGEISYSIYLCHFPIMMVLFKLLYTKIPIFFLLTLCIAMTLLFYSFISFNRKEMYQLGKTKNNKFLKKYNF